MQRKNKWYPIHQSPFYKLTSKKKLASVFSAEVSDLSGLIKRDDNYRVFEIGKNLGKARTVEYPKPHINRFHQRVFTLLSRIDPPCYLHSGVKGRSYITNAKAHRGCSRLVTLDIEAFYPSTRRCHVFEFFNDSMKCSPDVAGMLASLLTYEDHVPTGSAASQIVAFYAHLSLFQEIYDFCNSLGLTMTCYVDDIVISGDKATRHTLNRVRGIIRKRGLVSKRSKERLYEPGSVKTITGCILVRDELFAPNRLHKEVYEDIEALGQMEDDESKRQILESAIGKVNAIAQLDARVNGKLEGLKQERNRLSKTLHEKGFEKVSEHGKSA